MLIERVNIMDLITNTMNGHYMQDGFVVIPINE